MFIDYLTLVMINMIAGTVLLAYYLWKGLDDADQKPYSAAFGGVGLLALVLGLHLSFTWPLPGAYNIAFGETTTLFGLVFLGTALSLAKGWSLVPVAIYAFFAGLDGVLVGVKILSAGLTKEPVFSAIGFILAGAGGIFSAPFFLWFRENRMVRFLGILLLLVTALLWGVTYYGALGGHLDTFAKYLPATMLAPK